MIYYVKLVLSLSSLSPSNFVEIINKIDTKKKKKTANFTYISIFYFMGIISVLRTLFVFFLGTGAVKVEKIRYWSSAVMSMCRTMLILSNIKPS